MTNQQLQAQSQLQAQRVLGTREKSKGAWLKFLWFNGDLMVINGDLL